MHQKFLVQLVHYGSVDYINENMKEEVRMKKIFLISLLISISLISVMGCSSKVDTIEPDVKKQKKEEIKKEEIKKDEIPKEINLETPKENQIPNEEKKIEIYYSNTNADGLCRQEVLISQLTADQIFEALYAKNVVPSNVKAIDCQEIILNEEKVIELNLSTSFSEYLNTLGSAGESITMKSIVNTFLKAFECEKIHITIEGELLATGHKEYFGYLVYSE